VSDVGKGALDVSGGDQEGERERIAEDVSKETRVTSKPGCTCYPGMSLAGARLLARWCPAWKRREPDQAAFTWNVRRRAPIPLSYPGMARGSVPAGRNRKGLSTVAGRAGGLARSSDEVPVMGTERRGQVIRGLFARSTGDHPGGVAWTS
jgi:hypothetical protein